MPLEIQIVTQPIVPLEVEGIVPDRLASMSLDEIRAQEIFHGNEKAELGDFFSIAGDPSDQRHIWQGDLAGVHWLGAKMKSGSLRVDGNAGRHVGSEMEGGVIQVTGDAGDWVGGEQKGGLISVGGRAGHLIGAAYRGSQRGMTGGMILIRGDVGNEIGHTMRRGTIAVGGNAGDLVGFSMLAGTIFVFGEAGIRHGAGMRRGTIGFFGDVSPKPLPTFRHSCRYTPPMMTLLFDELRKHEFAIPDGLEDGTFDLYRGILQGGRGEMIVRAL